MSKNNFSDDAYSKELENDNYESEDKFEVIDFNEKNMSSNSEFFNIVLIPKDRIAVLIGKKGSVKRQIETDLNIKLHIDSEQGEVKIKAKDGLNLFNAQNIIKAIARGFNPDIALQLLSANNLFELINITDFAKTKNDLFRIRSRLIGTQGKSRTTIENLTETNIVVYGKTVGIIGSYENVLVAKDALVTLMQGSPHSKIFHWLEKKRKSLNNEQLKEEFDVDRLSNE